MTPERRNCLDFMVTATRMQFYPNIEAKEYYEEYADTLRRLFDNLPPEWFDYFASVLNNLQPGA
jgi:hypothetical protein